MGNLSRQGERPIVLPVTLCALVLMLVGCGKPFRAPTLIRPGSAPLSAQTLVNGLTVEAAAITDEDTLMQLFNANLRLARLLVIRLTLKNQGREPVDLSRLRLSLTDVQRRPFAWLKPQEAVRQLYEYYEISFYRVAAREAVEAEFQREAFPLNGRLENDQERRGLLFFRFPEGVDTLGPLDEVTLSLERLRWSGSDREMTVELRLTENR